MKMSFLKARKVGFENEVYYFSKCYQIVSRISFNKMKEFYKQMKNVTVFG